MSNKFHISPDGNVRQCRAQTPESCRATVSRFKEHFDTKEEAREGYEAKMKKLYPQAGIVKRATAPNPTAPKKYKFKFNDEDLKEIAELEGEIKNIKDIIQEEKEIMYGFQKSEFSIIKVTSPKALVRRTKHIKPSVKHPEDVKKAYINLATALKDIKDLPKRDVTPDEIRNTFKRLKESSEIAQNSLKTDLLSEFNFRKLPEILTNTHNSRTYFSQDYKITKMLDRIGFDIHRGFPLGTTHRNVEDFVEEYLEKERIKRKAREARKQTITDILKEEAESVAKEEKKNRRDNILSRIFNRS